MKIAVEISGHLRTFETCAPLLRRYLLDRYDCDVFIHTWDKLDHGNQTYHGGIENKTYPSLEVSDDLKQKLQEWYQPKQVVYHDSDAVKKVDGFFRPERLNAESGIFSLQAIWNTFFTEVEASKLRQAYQQASGVEYDFVIRTRPDIALLEPMVIENFLPLFQFHNDSCVFFPGSSFVASGRTEYGAAYDYGFIFASACDVFYLCRPATMDKLMNGLLDAFDGLFREFPETLPPEMRRYLDVETMFLYYSLKKNILPHFGRINKVIKRLDSAKDIIQVHQDRIDNSRQHLHIQK